MTVQDYWKMFLEENNLPSDTVYFDALYFGFDKPSATHLLHLVLEGKKIATSSAEEEYLLSNERKPAVNDYSVITDFEGIPKCIIQTTEVMTLKFSEVTDDLCKLEGEDLSLQTWQDKHIEFFNTVGPSIGYQFRWEMPILFEKFKVVYK